MAVKQIRIEDINIDIPISVDSRVSKATQRTITGGLLTRSKRYNQATININLRDLTETQELQLRELTRNWAFNNTILSGISNVWDCRLAIDRTSTDYLWYDRQETFSATIQLEPLWNLIGISIERSLHDRWKYLIMEDFSTDGVWPNNANLTGVGTWPNEHSTGYGSQLQDIPWDEISGDWGTDNTTYLIGDNSLESLSTNGYIVAGWEWWSNYEVSCWVRITTSTNDDVGLVFRYNDSTHFYRFYTTDNTGVYLYKYNGSGTVLAFNDSFNIVTGTWYHFKVVCQGNRIRCYIDTDEVFDIVDKSLTSGKVGCHAHAASVYFDDFRVTLLPPVNFNLPSCADWTNQYTHVDVETAFGTQQKIIDPQDNVQFKLSKAGGNCMLYLPMEEGNGDVVRDYSPYHNAVKIVNATWVEDDDKGEYLDFNGSNAFISITDSDVLDGFDQFTIDMLVRIDSFTTWNYLIEKRNAYYIRVNSSGQIQFEVNGSSGNQTITTDRTLSLDTWYRITTTYGSQELRIYVDKELWAAEIKDVGIHNTTAYNVELMRTYDGAFYTDGNIKDVRIFDSMRNDVVFGFDGTPATVFIFDDNRFNSDVPDDSDCILRLHFDEGSGTTVYDSSGKGHDNTGGTFPAWTNTSARGELGTCLDFNGSTHFLNFGDHNDFSFNGNNPFTISFWFYHDSVTGRQTFISKYDGATREWFVEKDVNHNMNFWIFDSSGNSAHRDANGTTIAADKWYFCVCTYSGSGGADNCRIYLNGERVDDYSDAGAFSGDMGNTTVSMEIGRLDSATGLYVNGKIDQVRILKGHAVSAEEAASLYRGEPYNHDWYQWTRVYHKTRDWKGLPVITNGLIMVSFPEYDLYEERTSNVLLPTIYGWYENSWHLLGYINPQIRYTGENKGLINSCLGSEWEIEELTDQYCKIGIRYYDVNDDDWPKGTKSDVKLIIRNGFAGVFIECDTSDWLKSDQLGFAFSVQYTRGTGTTNRFVYMPKDNIYDDHVQTSDQGRLTSQVDDNWAILFGSSDDSDAPCKNVIIGLFADHMYDDLGTGNCWWLSGSAGTDWWTQLYNFTKNGGIFFVPYDIDDLFQEADSDYADVTTTGDNDQTTLSGYTGDGYIQLTGTTEYAQWNVGTLPKGEYMTIARVASNDATAGNRDGIMNVDNDGDQDGDLATKTFQVAAQNTWEYQFLIFYTDGSHDVYLSIENASATDTIFIDHWFCILLSNAVNYPSDFAHMGLRDTKVVRN